MPFLRERRGLFSFLAMPAPRLQLDTTDLRKIGKGLLIAAAGGALTYMTGTLIPDLQESEAANTLAFVLFSAAVNAAQKWLLDYSKGEDDA